MIPKTLRQRSSLALRRRYLKRIYSRFKQFTMIPQATYVSNLFLARRIEPIEGSIVECGVWKGGMSAGLATLLGSSRKYHLFDSFEGLPEAKQIDGEAAIDWQNDSKSENFYDNCTASEFDANEAMKLSGVKTYSLHKGWFSETIPSFTSDLPIALLRLDGDWYDSTMTCLESLYDHVSPGGIIILDDYHTWDGCSRAVHDFLSRRSATERIREFSGICYIEKRAASGQHN